MTEPFYADDSVTLHHGDCLDVLAALPDNSVDSVVCDPPYGLEFMGKEWDSFKQAPTGGAKIADVSMPGTGFTKLPNYKGSPNPTCRNCKGMKRGQDRPGFTRCKCDNPDFPNVGLKQNQAFGEWCRLWTAECLRVLKPGGHLLAFGGTRTWHRLAVAVEDAGFEVRDSIAWLYGSGFPKSLDVSKAIDKARDDRHSEALTVTVPMREAMHRLGISRRQMNQACGLGDNDAGSAQNWTTATADGACKPRVPTIEQWTVLRDLLGLRHLDAEVWRLNGRKGAVGHAWAQRQVIGEVRHARSGGGDFAKIPGSTPTPRVEAVTAPATPAAQQWQGWGTSLKPAFEPVVVARKPLAGTVAANVLAHGVGALNIDGCRVGTEPAFVDRPGTKRVGGIMNPPAGGTVTSGGAGRWPANVVLDGSQADALDEQSGTSTSRIGKPRGADSGDGWGMTATGAEYADEGGPSRFFPTFRYQAKAPTRERVKVDGVAHPTVKPLELMRWLVRLVTPPGGVVLEPFAGSGTTVEAAILEGFRCVAIEREADYLPLILERIRRCQPQGLTVDASGVDAPLLFDEPVKPAGRWPTNVVMDRSQAAELDEQSGPLPSQKKRSDPAKGTAETGSHLGGLNAVRAKEYLGETGGASRFFPVFDNQPTLFDDDGDAA